jgi:tetratricopeptide (TPR) repeat protein
MKLLLIILFLVAAAPLHAQEATFQFDQANKLYRDGEMQKAVDMYEQIAHNGYESPVLYYNLGNAYFKLKNIPAAILNYERAKRLAPHDEDIAYNLRLANIRIIDKIEPIPQLFFIDWWNALMNLFSSSGWGMIGIFSLWGTVFCGALFWLIRSMTVQRMSFFLGLMFVLIAILAFTGVVQQFNHEQNDRTAIIFSASVSAKSAPDAQSTDLFVLHEGVKVELLDAVGNWSKIRLGDGKIGWVPIESTQAI